MIGHVAPVKKGDHLTLARFNQVRQSAISSHFRNAQSGVNVMQGATGTNVYFEPSKDRWVYAVGVTDDGHVLVKTAVPLQSAWPSGKLRWHVSPGIGGVLKVRPAPNYGLAHFVFHVIDGEQPGENDQTCEIRNGYLIPHQRMQQVAPAAVQSLCGPCPSGATQATNAQGQTVSMRRKPKCTPCEQKIKAKMKYQTSADVLNAMLTQEPEEVAAEIAAALGVPQTQGDCGCA